MQDFKKIHLLTYWFDLTIDNLNSFNFCCLSWHYGIITAFRNSMISVSKPSSSVTTSLRPGLKRNIKSDFCNFDFDCSQFITSKFFIQTFSWEKSPDIWLCVLNKLCSSVGRVNYPSHEKGEVVLVVVDVEQERSRKHICLFQGGSQSFGTLMYLCSNQLKSKCHKVWTRRTNCYLGNAHLNRSFLKGAP